MASSASPKHEFEKKQVDNSPTRPQNQFGPAAQSAPVQSLSGQQHFPTFNDGPTGSNDRLEGKQAEQPQPIVVSSQPSSVFPVINAALGKISASYLKFKNSSPTLIKNTLVIVENIALYIARIAVLAIDSILSVTFRTRPAKGGRQLQPSFEVKPEEKQQIPDKNMECQTECQPPLHFNVSSEEPDQDQQKDQSVQDRDRLVPPVPVQEQAKSEEEDSKSHRLKFDFETKPWGLSPEKEIELNALLHKFCSENLAQSEEHKQWLREQEDMEAWEKVSQIQNQQQDKENF